MALWKDEYNTARKLFVRKRHSEALSVSAALAQKYPRVWKITYLCAEICLAQGNVTASKSWSKILDQTNANDGVRLILTIEIARADKDRWAEMRALREFLVIKPENTNALKRLLVLLSPVSDQIEFFKRLKEYFDREDAPQLGYPVFHSYVKTMDGDEFIRRTDELVRSFPLFKPLRMARVTAGAKANAIEMLWAEIEALFACDPDPNVARSVQLTLKENLMSNMDYHPAILRLHQTYPKSQFLLWLYAETLKSLGKTDEYRTLIYENWDWLKEKRPPTRATIVALSGLGASALPENSDDQTKYYHFLLADLIDEAIGVAPSSAVKIVLQEISVLRGDKKTSVPDFSFLEPCRVVGPERKKGIVIVFGGLSDKYSFPAATLDHAFAHLGLTAIYLKDFSRLIYLNGVEGLGHNYKDTLSALSLTIQGLPGPARPLHTFGMSAGSYAAMIYGAALGANKSLVFSPPAGLSEDTDKHVNETRSRVVLRRIRSNVNLDNFELSESLEAANKGYRVTACVPAGSAVDCRHAKLIEAMPRTNVQYIKGCDVHNVLPVVAARRGLVSLLSKAFDMG